MSTQIQEVVAGWKLGGELSEALGLPANVSHLTLEVPAGGAVTLICTYHPNGDLTDALSAVVKRYQLVELAEEEPAE